MYIAVANYIAVATGKNTVLPFSICLYHILFYSRNASACNKIHTSAFGNFCTSY